MKKVENKVFILGLITVMAFLLSLLQVKCVNAIYQRFFTDFNHELWENHVGEDAFYYSYFFTASLLVLGFVVFKKKWPSYSKIQKTIQVLVILSIVISLAASTWLFILHKKGIVVGYGEWITHGQSLHQERQ